MSGAREQETVEVPVRCMDASGFDLVQRSPFEREMAEAEVRRLMQKLRDEMDRRYLQGAG